MLHRMMHRKEQRVAVQPPAAPMDAAARAVTAIKRARVLLTPFAEAGSLEPLTWAEKKKIFDKTGKLGGPEGIGVLLRLAAVEVSGDTIAPAAFAQLQAAGEDAMDTIQNLMLNWTVLLSLFLTIYVTLAVIHSGAPAYRPIDQNEQQLAFATRGEDSEYAIWGDLASFAWPDDVEAQAGLRRGLYVAECITIVVCLLLCGSGLMTAVCIYSFVGAGLPDALSKIEYLIDALAYVFFMWPCFDFVVIFLFLALGLVTARSSAIMSIACFTAVGLSQLHGMFFIGIFGPVAIGHLQQWRVAKRIIDTHSRPMGQPASQASA